MIPRTPWRSRIRLAWEILRGRVYIDRVRHLGWGEHIHLRTVDDVRLGLLVEGQR